MSSYIPRSLLNTPQTEDSNLTYRMSMLPLGAYSGQDGQQRLGFAVPGMISEPVNALVRLMGTPSHPGTFAQGPDNPQAASDMRTLLEATFGGNAINPAAALPENALGMFGSLFKRKKNYDFWESATDAQPTTTVSSSKVSSSLDMISGMSQPAYNPADLAAPSLEESASPIRAYHGTAADVNGAFQPSEWGTFGPALYAAYDHPTMGPGADFAASFASMPSGGNYSGMLETVPDGAKIFPMNVNGNMATGEQYLQAFANAPGNTAAEKETNAIASLRQKGFDGAAAHGEMGIWNRGTVTSPLTGETLFSDTGLRSLLGPSLQTQQQQPSRDPLLDMPPAIVQEYPGVSGLQTFASGGNVADTSGLSGLRSIPDYGFGPMTPTTIAGYPNSYISASPDPIEHLRNIGQSGAFPVLLHSTADQIGAAGKGIADAMTDPSLANVTNAGVNTGLALMSPELTVGSAAAGYGLAGLRDLYHAFVPNAEARKLGKPNPVPEPVAQVAPETDDLASKVAGDPQLEVLYGAYKQAQAKATAQVPGVDRASSDAIRQRASDQATAIMGQISSALAAKAEAGRALEKQNYDQQVQEAIAARDLARSRDVRFTDTDVGKVYNRVGVGPLLAGAVPGLINGLAKGPATTGMGHLWRGLEGAGFGIGAAFAPDVFNMTQAPAANPEKEALKAYAFNLPDGHPDKAKAEAYAATLPDLNPVQTAAKENLRDPWLLAERIGGGAAEGVGGALAAQYLPLAFGKAFKPSTYDWNFGGSSAVPERIEPTLPSLSAVPREIPEDVSALRAGIREAADRSSGAAGPASAPGPLPRLGEQDIAPASPARKPRGARRSKSAGSTDLSGTEPILPASQPDTSLPSPETQDAAANELRRIFGSSLAPKPGDFKSAGGGVEGHALGDAEPVHVGALHSHDGGRTDTLPITVRAGSFVIPSDCVSALGENNSQAGMRILDHVFPKEPESLHYSAGGAVPIMAAGGEYVVQPETVARIGGGDIDHGHNVLDQFVLNTRKDAIKTLKSLPGPSR